MSELELQMLIEILGSINDNLLSLRNALKDFNISSLEQLRNQLEQQLNFDKKNELIQNLNNIIGKADECRQDKEKRQQVKETIKDLCTTIYTELSNKSIELGKLMKEAEIAQGMARNLTNVSSDEETLLDDEEVEILEEDTTGQEVKVFPQEKVSGTTYISYVIPSLITLFGDRLATSICQDIYSETTTSWIAIATSAIFGGLATLLAHKIIKANNKIRLIATATAAGAVAASKISTLAEKSAQKRIPIPTERKCRNISYPGKNCTITNTVEAYCDESGKNCTSNSTTNEYCMDVNYTKTTCEDVPIMNKPTKAKRGAASAGTALGVTVAFGGVLFLTWYIANRITQKNKKPKKQKVRFKRDGQRIRYQKQQGV